MAFRLSSHRKNGQRISTVLKENGEAKISCDSDSDIQQNIPENASIAITESGNSLSLKVEGVVVNVKGKDIQDESITIGSGAQFTCAEQDYYVTKTISGEPTPRKKGYLSTIAITLIWALLAIQLIVPAWLPSKITGHKVKGRNVLIENCSKGLDILRAKFRKERNNVESYSQIHRDVILRLSEEVEQIAWVYRHAGEFMSKEELEKLEKDIGEYASIIGEVRKAEAVDVEPLTTENAVKKLLKSK